MAQFLPEVPSFGQTLARNLSAGVSKGLEQSGDFASKLMQKKVETSQRQKLLDDIRNRNKSSSQNFSDEFSHLKPQIEEKLGFELTDDQFSKIVPQLRGETSRQEEDPFREAEELATIGEHDLSKVALERGKQRQKENFARESAELPKVEALETKLESLEASDLNLSRLNQLFSPELDNKFPPSLAVGMFTKEGELTPLAQSQLSPEAQEAVKLTTNQVKGLKDTFGSQITGFEVKTFLKTLPTLLNSAEGRRKILRDLRIVNELNRHESEGVLDIIDKYGSGKISVSKAKRMYKKENADYIKEMKDSFIHPDKQNFNRLPPASLYEGQQIEDEETGQIFISDGNDWLIQ
jgi:hypothetical protein